MVLLIVATVVGALTPSVVRTISHARVNRAANVVAADLMLAQSLAGRQHLPVVVAIDSTNRQHTINQPPPANTNLITRRFGVDSEFRLARYMGTPASILILPNGTGSSALTVTVGDASYFRTVKMSRAGQVRVL